MPAIHAIRTGLMKVRRAQMESRGTGPARIAHMLLDEEWTRASRIVAPRPVRLGGTTIFRQGASWANLRLADDTDLIPRLRRRRCLLGTLAGS
jgi:hypothetical protein